MLTIVKKSASYGHTRRFPRASGREGSPCLIFSLPVKFAEGAMIPGTQVPSPAVGCAACRALTAVHCDTWRRPPRIPPPPGKRHPKHPSQSLSDSPSPLTGRVGLRVELKHRRFGWKKETNLTFRLWSSMQFTWRGFNRSIYWCMSTSTTLCGGVLTLQLFLLTLRERHTLNFNLLDV